MRSIPVLLSALLVPTAALAIDLPWSLSATSALDGPRDVLAVDVDTDGDEDIVVAEQGAGKVIVLLNLGASFVSQTIDSSLPDATYLAAADLDKDGDPDIVASSSGGALFHYTNDGTGIGWTEYDPGFSTGGPIVTLDLDDDGDIDYATADPTTSRIRTYFNGNCGNLTCFTSGSTLVSSIPYSLAVGRIDADYDSDFVFALAGGGVF
jgi:hypothetical protein